MKIVLSTIILCFCIFVQVTLAYGPYPVPIPKGGRMAVHGWLILPWDQETPTDPTTPIGAYFVHHTPEFWTDSPHNFQLILGGTLTPMSVAENQTYVIDLPYPPQSELLVDEFTFTPPPPFSLNDLLSGRIEQLVGVVYNGSFDTLYERVPIALATLDITEMPTAIWLNISNQIPNSEQLRYFSYPRSRSVQTSGNADFYMSHEIHSMNTNPDFDQVIHTQIDLDSCTCKSCSSVSEMFTLLSKPGIEWEIPSIKNSLSNRLMAPQKVVAALTEQMIQCNMIVLEEIHCVVGPAFANRC